MTKPFIRIIAALLIPCLLGDPTLASGLWNPACQTHQKRFPGVFNEQAISAPEAATLQPISAFARIAMILGITSGLSGIFGDGMAQEKFSPEMLGGIQFFDADADKQFIMALAAWPDKLEEGYLKPLYARGIRVTSNPDVFKAGKAKGRGAEKRWYYFPRPKIRLHGLENLKASDLDEINSIVELLEKKGISGSLVANPRYTFLYSDGAYHLEDRGPAGKPVSRLLNQVVNSYRRKGLTPPSTLTLLVADDLFTTFSHGKRSGHYEHSALVIKDRKDEDVIVMGSQAMTEIADFDHLKLEQFSISPEKTFNFHTGLILRAVAQLIHEMTHVAAPAGIGAYESATVLYSFSSLVEAVVKAALERAEETTKFPVAYLWAVFHVLDHSPRRGDLKKLSTYLKSYVQRHGMERITLAQVRERVAHFISAHPDIQEEEVQQLAKVIHDAGGSGLSLPKAFRRAKEILRSGAVKFYGEDEPQDFKAFSDALEDLYRELQRVSSNPYLLNLARFEVAMVVNRVRGGEVINVTGVSWQGGVEAPDSLGQAINRVIAIYSRYQPDPDFKSHLSTLHLQLEAVSGLLSTPPPAPSISIPFPSVRPSVPVSPAMNASFPVKPSATKKRVRSEIHGWGGDRYVLAGFDNLKVWREVLADLKRDLSSEGVPEDLEEAQKVLDTILVELHNRLGEISDVLKADATQVITTSRKNKSNPRRRLKVLAKAINDRLTSVEIAMKVLADRNSPTESSRPAVTLEEWSTLVQGWLENVPSDFMKANFAPLEQWISETYDVFHEMAQRAPAPVAKAFQHIVETFGDMERLDVVHFQKSATYLRTALTKHLASVQDLIKQQKVQPPEAASSGSKTTETLRSILLIAILTPALWAASLLAAAAETVLPVAEQAPSVAEKTSLLAAGGLPGILVGIMAVAIGAATVLWLTPKIRALLQVLGDLRVPPEMRRWFSVPGWDFAMLGPTKGKLEFWQEGTDYRQQHMGDQNASSGGGKQQEREVIPLLEKDDVSVAFEMTTPARARGSSGSRVLVDDLRYLAAAFGDLLDFLFVRSRNKAAYDDGTLKADVPKAFLENRERDLETELIREELPESYRLLTAARDAGGLIHPLEAGFDPTESIGALTAVVDRDGEGRPYRWWNFGGLGTFALGHNHLEVIKAFLSKFHHLIDRYPYSEYQTDLSLKFIAGLAEVAPKGCGHAYLIQAGAEAAENAVKAVIFKHRKEKKGHRKEKKIEDGDTPTDEFFLISFLKAFHGRTLGALGLTESRRAREGFATFNWPKVPFAYARFVGGRILDDDALKMSEGQSLKEIWNLMVRGRHKKKHRTFNAWEEDVTAIDTYLEDLYAGLEGVSGDEREAAKAARLEAFKKQHQERIKTNYEAHMAWAKAVLGITIEPIQGEGGIRFASPRYYQRLQMLAVLYGVPDIWDEIQTGNGRTGTLWNFEQLDLPKPPAIVVTAKVAGMGILFVNDEMSHFFEEEKKFNNTYGGNADGMIRYPVILKVLDLEAIKELGRYAVAELLKLHDKFPSLLTEVRGQGVMIGFSNPSPDVRKPYKVRDALKEELFRRGLLLDAAGEDTLRFYPRYDATHREIDAAIQILNASLEYLQDQHAIVMSSDERELASSASSEPVKYPNRLKFINGLIDFLRELDPTTFPKEQTFEGWKSVRVNEMARRHGLQPREVRAFLVDETEWFKREVSHPGATKEDPQETLEAGKGKLLFDAYLSSRRKYIARLEELRAKGRIWAGNGRNGSRSITLSATLAGQIRDGVRSFFRDLPGGLVVMGFTFLFWGPRQATPVAISLLVSAFLMHRSGDRAPPDAPSIHSTRALSQAA